MARFAILALALAGCTAPVPDAFEWPAPADSPALRGPGGPSRAFTASELGQPCAYLVGGPEDFDRHNLVQPYRGHLLMPWGPEWGQGGLSLFEVDDPCDPVAVGHGYDLNMRETHTVGLVHLPADHPHAGDWAVTNATAGILIWDLSDPTAPVVAGRLELDEVIAIDSYARLTFSVVWQYPWIFVAAADNGLIVVDATDPRAPVEVARHTFEPLLRAGMVQVHGNIARVGSLKEFEHALVDVSNPRDPRPIPGGRFVVTDGDGVPRSTYASNSYGDFMLFARKDAGSGPIVYDVSDPTAPAFVLDLPLEGSGGYIFGHEDHLFIGSGDHGDVIDVTDFANPVHTNRFVGDGDQDTLIPWGNVVVLASDDKVQVTGHASAVIPWREAPDTVAPRLLSVDPADGATQVATSARIGLAFSEMVEPTSVFPGSVRLSTADGTPVPGVAGAHENIGFYTPQTALLPSTTYVVEVLAGGVFDVSGNTIDVETTFSFTTGAR